MKKRMIRGIVLALAAMLTCSLSACGAEDDNTVVCALSYYATTAFPEGQSPEKNEWTTLIEQELGFKVKYKFAVPSTTYESKINADIASGQIPHMFYVTKKQLPTLIRAKMIRFDLETVYREQATELTKKVMGWDETLGIDSPNFRGGVVDGKLVALPWTDSSYDTSNIMYIRGDWLKAAKLGIPRTVDELENVLTVFKEKFGSKGLGATNTFYANNGAAITGIFNIFGAYPQIWTEYDDNGTSKLDLGYLRPEMKQGLERLRSWYAKGLLYQQFATSTLDTIGEKVAAGEIGVWFGNMSLPLFKMNSTVSNIDGADWVAAPVPDLDAAHRTKVTNSSAVYRYHVVRKDYQHPERLVQMINLFTEKLWGENADYEKFEIISSAFPFQAWSGTKNLDFYKAVTPALDSDKESDWWQDTVGKKTVPAWTGDETDRPLYYSISASDHKLGYNQIRRYLQSGIAETNRDWAMTRIFYRYEDPDGFRMLDGKVGFECSQSVVEYYIENDLIYDEKYLGLDTPSLIDKRSTIETEMGILITDVIMGKKPLDYFDMRVAELRGDYYAGKAIEEVNAIVAASRG